MISTRRCHTSVVRTRAANVVLPTPPSQKCVVWCGLVWNGVPCHVVVAKRSLQKGQLLVNARQTHAYTTVGHYYTEPQADTPPEANNVWTGAYPTNIPAPMLFTPKLAKRSALNNAYATRPLPRRAAQSRSAMRGFDFPYKVRPLHDRPTDFPAELGAG